MVKVYGYMKMMSHPSCRFYDIHDDTFSYRAGRLRMEAPPLGSIFKMCMGSYTAGHSHTILYLAYRYYKAFMGPTFGLRFGKFNITTMHRFDC